LSDYAHQPNYTFCCTLPSLEPLPPLPRCHIVRCGFKRSTTQHAASHNMTMQRINHKGLAVQGCRPPRSAARTTTHAKSATVVARFSTSVSEYCITDLQDSRGKKTNSPKTRAAAEAEAEAKQQQQASVANHLLAHLALASNRIDSVSKIVKKKM